MNRMSTIIGVACIVLASCAREPTGPGEAYVLPDFTGVVFWTDGRTPTDSTAAGLLLKDIRRPRRPDAPSVGDTVAILVLHTTARFVRSIDSSLVAAPSAYPAIGKMVQVWHNGVELRSYPPGYFATRLEIFEGS